jgi:hypothetical protein
MKRSLFKFSLLSTLAAASLWMQPAQAALEDNLRYLSSEAEAVVNISTSREDWGYFLERKAIAEMLEKSLRELVPALSNGFGIDTEKELMPLLGTHISLAFSTHDAQQEEALPGLIAVDIADGSGFPGIIEKLRQKAASEKDRTLIEEQIEGQTLYGFASADKTREIPFIALNQKTLLIGNRERIRQALKTLASGQNISQHPRFASTYKSLSGEKIWTFIKPALISRALESELPQSGNQANNQEIRQLLNVYDSLGFGLDFNQRGVRIKSFITFNKNGPDTPQKKYLRQIEQSIRQPQAPLKQLLQAAPERPIFFAAGQGFHLLHTGLKSFLGQEPELRALMDELLLNGFRELTHLDLDKDLLAQSDGRAGISIFYPEKTKQVEQAPNVVIYLGVKNNAQMLKTLQSKLLLDFSAFEEEVPANQKQKKKKQALTITFPKKPQAQYRGAPLYMANLTPAAQGLKNELGIQAGYTHVGNLWFFGSNMESLKSAIDYARQYDASLLDNGYLGALRDKHGLQEDAGLMFMDLGRLVSLAKMFMGEDEEMQKALPTLEAMKGMLAGGRYTDEGNEGVFLLDINMDQVDFDLIAKFLSEEETPKDEAPAEPAPAP